MSDLNNDGKQDVVTANPGKGPYTVSVLLNNTTNSGTPGATLTPPTITFPIRDVGSVSPPIAVTLTNTGTATLQGILPNFGGTNLSDFMLQSNTCGTSLAVGSSCVFNISFAPTGVNTRTATFNVSDNAPNSPQTVSLSGIGTIVLLNPVNLSFGTVNIGTTSNPRAVTVKNVGTQTLNISSITVGGGNQADFAIKTGGTCPLPSGTLSGGASCTVLVTFTPSAKGLRSSTLRVADDGGASPQKVSLSGTGN
jgi:hypothetical protein